LTDSKYSPGKSGLILNLIFLFASILAVFYLFEPNTSFFLILIIYLVFSASFTVLLYICKVWLIKVYSSEDIERRSNIRPALTLFSALVLLFFLILFFIPNLWLIFMCGVVTGLSLSELAIYFRYKK